MNLIPCPGSPQTAQWARVIFSEYSTYRKDISSFLQRLGSLYLFCKKLPFICIGFLCQGEILARQRLFSAINTAGTTFQNTTLSLCHICLHNDHPYFFCYGKTYSCTVILYSIDLPCISSKEEMSFL